MIVNGVTLPDIPADVLAKYPNALILWSPQEVGSDGYMLLLTKGEIAYLPPSILGTSSPYLKSTNNGFARYMVAYPNNATEWILQAEMENYLMRFELLDTFSPVWANLDIYECTSLNLNTGAFTKGDIWFPNSETPKPPRYSIASTILDAVARQIMRLTGSSAKVKPEEFEPKLEGINIQLQELTVTATEEVQTITPPSGVYGFSKVIVEAVEDSGTSGGGGTGEGGDDSGGDTGEDEYAPAEDVAFGYEFDETPTETGYSYYNGNKLHTLSTNLPYVYIRTRTDKDVIFATASGAPFTQGAGSTTMQMQSSVPVTVEDWDYSSSSGWELSSSTESRVSSFSVSSPFKMYWCNEDVKTSTDADATVQFKGTAAIPETEGQYSGNYTQNDGTYTIEGSTLNELGGLVQKLTGTNETMTTAEMVAALRKLAGEDETTE